MTVNVTAESSDTEFKGIVHLDMKTLSSFTYPHVVPLQANFCLRIETYKR